MLLAYIIEILVKKTKDFKTSRSSIFIKRNNQP